MDRTMLVTITSTFIGEDGVLYTHFSDVERNAPDAARALIDSAIHFAGNEGTWNVSGSFSNVDPDDVEFAFVVTAKTDVARMRWSLSRV